MTLALRRIDREWLDPSEGFDGVIKAEALASADTARTVIERAQGDADRLLSHARAQAQDECQVLREDLERASWQAAADYARALQAEWDRALDELEGRIAQLVGRALRRLTDELPPEERLRACVRQLVAEAGTPDGGVLLVSPEAHLAVRGMADDVPWPVQSSDRLAAGTVRLESSHGHWECSINTVVERVVEALGPQPEEEQNP